MKARIHESHVDIQGCLEKKRCCIGQEWAETWRTASLSAMSATAKQENKPQSKLSDLFQLNRRDDTVTVDYYWSFFEVDRQTTKTDVEVIRKVKGHLLRHGIPDHVGQPFACDSFYEFPSTYGFQHVTSSPTYAHSNGKSENAVKTAKSLLEKAAKSKLDPYLSLLNWKKTPT